MPDLRSPFQSLLQDWAAPKSRTSLPSSSNLRTSSLSWMLLYSLLDDIFLTTSPTSSIWQETALSLVKVMGSFILNEMALKMLRTSAQMGSGPLGALLRLLAPPNLRVMSLKLNPSSYSLMLKPILCIT